MNRPQIQRQLTKARRASDQADKLFLQLPFWHTLEMPMLRIKCNWIRIERLWQQALTQLESRL